MVTFEPLWLFKQFNGLDKPRDCGNLCSIQTLLFTIVPHFFQSGSFSQQFTVFSLAHFSSFSEQSALTLALFLEGFCAFFYFQNHFLAKPVEISGRNFCGSSSTTFLVSPKNLVTFEPLWLFKHFQRFGQISRLGSFGIIFVEKWWYLYIYLSIYLSLSLSLPLFFFNFGSKPKTNSVSLLRYSRATPFNASPCGARVVGKNEENHRHLVLCLNFEV